MRCSQPGCSGSIVDGYCNVCGMPGAGAGTPAVPPPRPGQAARPGPARRPGSPARPPSPAHPAAQRTPQPSAPVMTVSGPCQMPGCGGQIVDGYCNTCGAPAGSTVVTPTMATTGRIGTVSLGSARATSGTVRRRPAADTTNAGGQLGSGYTTIPPEPLVDPRSAIVTNPEVPEDRRFCPHCNAEVGRSSNGTPGRLEGFCPSCSSPYSFTPKLAPGDLVAGQYEVRGCLAHGGMGWIYLAQDRNVSDRWVVLKGLLNAGDKASMQASMTEQRFLAQIQHPLIVEIFNFVTHQGGAYIVMEFVGGRSLKQILKDRLGPNGAYNPLPADQTLAYVLEILPAFSYLHASGLLYCDFKPDNLMHVENTVKLIDMGGVRRIDDDDSVIFGTVGFQAPEVSTIGCSVASDIFTIGRTLLVCSAQVNGYQTKYATTMPPPEETPALAEKESLYRLIARCCAADPSDRFTSVEELRQQMLGVLREVTSRGPAAATSAPSALFDPPTVVADAFTWEQLPRLKPDPTDPGLPMLASLDALTPPQRFNALMATGVSTLQTQIALCLTSIQTGAQQTLAKTVNEILTRDPWQWRAAWIQGLAALNQSEWAQAQSCFNAVYGQVPGELAPKFALAVACEMGGELDVAERLYQICAATDSDYVPGAAFGLARIRARRKDKSGNITDIDSVLGALDLVPTTSGGWAQSRRLAASYLTYSGQGLPALTKAYAAVHSAAASTEERLRLELEIFWRALPLAPDPAKLAAQGQSPPMIGDVPVTKPDLRSKLESLLRQQAVTETDPVKRVQLIDQANSLRKWTVI